MREWTFDSLRVGHVTHQRLPVIEPIAFEPEIDAVPAMTLQPFEPPPPLPELESDKRGWSWRDCARWIRCCW